MLEMASYRDQERRYDIDLSIVHMNMYNKQGVGKIDVRGNS